MTKDFEEFKTQILSEINSLLTLASEKISQMPSATTPLTGSEIIPLVQSGLNVKSTLNNISQSVFLLMGFVTVGNGPQYEYQEINLAVSDGKSNLFVVTDITETSNTVFSGQLNILCNAGISINFNDDINLTASSGQDIFHIACLYDGTVNISYKFNSDNILFDLSQIVSSPPGSMSGNFIIVNNSDPSVSAKPLVTQSSQPYAFEIDTVVYLTNGGLNSYFELGVGLVDNFILVCNAENDCFGIKILNNGNISNLLLGSPCSSNTTLGDLTDATVSNVVIVDTNSVPYLYLTNSVCNSAISQGSSALKVNMSAPNSGEVSIINNGRNIIPLLSGSVGSIINNCLIAGIDTNSSLTGGITKFSNCNFAGFLNIDNTDAYFNFSSCAFEQGLQITNSPGTQLCFCDYGVVGGSFGLTLDSGAINTIVVGGRTNTPVVDNGINTQIIPSPQIF